MDNSNHDDIEAHSNYISMTNYSNKKGNYYNSSIHKIKEKRSSNFSPTNKKKYFELKSGISTMKRFDTHYSKNQKKNQEKSYNSINPSRFKNRKSFKDLEHNIMSKILDISMKIEKEENELSSPNNNEQNFKLSTLVKSRIEGENNNDNICQSKNKVNNKLKLINQSNSNLKLDISKSNANNSRVSNNDNSKNNFTPRKPVSKYDKYRVLYQKNILYDSFDTEEEKKNEDASFYISPKSNFVLVFDFLILIFCLFDIIYTPLRLSKIDGFCTLPNNLIIYIYYCIDILYIIDLLLGFFRSYYNYQFIIINNKTRIFHHYIVTQFWSDFIEAIPAFSYIGYLCKKKNVYCNGYDISNKEMILLLLCFLKQAKLFKIIDIKNNSIMYIIKDIIAENEIIEQIVLLFITVGICVSCFYSFISIHIFIGRHSYPNWIIKAGFQDQPHLMLYLISFYYLMTTMTTVGYGDIVGVSLSEIIFQIIVLSVGITIYSWVVSNIGNYVKNESYASMQFNKDETILEEIRISHPNMSFKLYKHIYQHLHARKIRQQQYDSNLLINSLPYSLKNTVLLTIYKETINNMKIFRNCQNSDFIVRLLTNFIPLFSKKNAILIHEGQSVENIFFIKKGILSLQAAIDKEDPGDSIRYYLCKIFADNNNNDNSKINLSNYDESSFSRASSSDKPKDMKTHINRVKTTLYTVINKKAKNSIASEINESGIGKEMGKWDYGGEDFDKNKYHFLNIISISKNESCGVVYMILDKPCPLSLRVKSKKAELLILRKADACDISQRYPNIWMKYFKKSYYNMFSINNIAIKKLKYYWENLEKNLKKKKQPVKRCKTNLNLCCIYKINDFEVNEISKILNDNDNTKKMIQRAKTLGKIKCNLNGNMNRLFLKSNNNNSKNNYKNKSNISAAHYSGKNLKSSNPKLKSEQKSKVSNENKNGNGNSKNKISKLKITAKSSLKYISSGKLGKTDTKSINSKNNRRNYINKLKIEIKKLKNSNKYYKSLLKEVCTTKEIDENLLLKLQNNKIIDNKINEKENNLSINFCQNLNQNIINNITINNTIDNKSSLFKKSLNLNELEYESTITESPRKFDTDEIKIKSEIKLFYKAKYTNLIKFTSGEYSKNEKLQKQCLNYLQLYIETDKKKISKKTNQKNNRERRKSSYMRNYDFRDILNKFNLRNQKKNENLMSNKFIHNNNNENKIQDMFEKFKNNYFKKKKNKGKKDNLSQTPVNREDKSHYSTKENTVKNSRKQNIYQLRANNECEKEILGNKSDNNKSKLNSINLTEKNKNSYIATPKNISSGKSMSSFNLFKLESYNNLSSQFK